MSDIAKLAGMLDAAYFVHARADSYRSRRRRELADALDQVADALKAEVVRRRIAYDQARKSLANEQEGK